MSKHMTDDQPSGPPSAVPPPDPGEPVADVDAELVDKLLERAEREGVDLLGPDGLLSSLTKTVLERALDAELTAHLGYERGDPAGHGSGNSRNGSSGKRVHTDVGTVHIDVSRDRNATFAPAIVPKGSTRLRGFNDRSIALYARGLTVRDIQAHLGEIYGVTVSPDLISTVTNAVLDEVREWQNRPLDRVYAAIYLDAIRCKVRHEGWWSTRPPIWPWASTPTGSKTSWASGSTRPKARNSGCRSAMSRRRPA
jgi:putative transposase